MKFRAKYFANLKDGKRIYLCAAHIVKVAKKLDDAGRMSPKKGVRSVGSLSQYSLKTCRECAQGH
jgi:hypothetical protein